MVASQVNGLDLRAIMLSDTWYKGTCTMPIQFGLALLLFISCCKITNSTKA